ncbi:MAG: hypothetical protein GY842_16880 [bacterium]|nr:hypothetical protein [bacterium]
MDQALELHQERLAVFDDLGDRRSRAVTLGDIARILVAKGEVDQALVFQQERLCVNESLGDLDGIAAALWDIAQIDLQRQDLQSAEPRLSESYSIFLKLGRLEGICIVGLYLGQLLCRGGQTEEGRTILTRSRDGFRHLGQNDLARRADEALQQLPGDDNRPG